MLAYPASAAVNSLTTASQNIIAEPYDPLPTENPDGFCASSNELPNSFEDQSRKRAQVPLGGDIMQCNKLTLKHMLSFFLHTSLPVGKDDGVGTPTYFFDHINLLDFYAFGNIKTLAKKLPLDKGMLDYLDNTQNNKTTRMIIIPVNI